MTLHRFMSAAEYEILIAGGKLINATYRDNEKDNIEGMSFLDLIFLPAPQIERKEYCMTEYSLKVAKVLRVTMKYRDYFEKILSGEWDKQGTFTARIQDDDEV